MNWYKIFYFLTVSDSVRDLFGTIAGWTCFFAVIGLICMVVFTIMKAVQISDSKTKTLEEDKINSDVRSVEMARKYSTRFFYTMLGICLLFGSLRVLVPSKDDCLLIIAGGSVGNFLSSDSSAK